MGKWQEMDEDELAEDLQSTSPDKHIEQACVLLAGAMKPDEDAAHVEITKGLLAAGQLHATLAVAKLLSKDNAGS